MATQIHATAIVAQETCVGEDCCIGAYCVVGPDVRLGAGTRLHSHVVIDGNTALGERCEVFPFASLGKQTQDLKYEGGAAAVEIGDDTTIREYVTVNAATAAGGATSIGAHCHILAYSHIAHECRLGNRVIMSNGTQLAGHVIVEDNVVFGGMAGVHQFVRIGTTAMVSATAKVIQDVAPFCLVDGNPAVPVGVNKIGMQRNGRSEEAIAAVGRAYKTLFRANLTLEAALQRLSAEQGDVPEIEHMVRFIQGSERGLARPRQSKS